VPLDLETLGVVRAEVSRRAADRRQQWRLEPADAGLVAVRELELLGSWLDDQLVTADAALDERVSLTELGIAVLLEAEREAAPPEALRFYEQPAQLRLEAAS
jgi:hypothetical protein